MVIPTVLKYVLYIENNCFKASQLTRVFWMPKVYFCQQQDRPFHLGFYWEAVVNGGTTET